MLLFTHVLQRNIMPSEYTRILSTFQPAQYLYRRLFFLACFVVSLNTATANASEISADSSAAVIYAYQRIGEDSMPHASLSVDQFSAQLAELKRGNYVVKPLSEVTAALRAGQPLPRKTVVITFDGAYRSTIDKAIPMLDQEGYPYTIFFSSESIDGGGANSVTWGDLRSLSKKKHVELGIMPAYYAHMVGNAMPANVASINKALGRFDEEIGGQPAYFAWPYGEYSTALKNKLAEYPFTAAFTYHAGVAHTKSDMLALPRFIMNDLVGDIDRFKQTASALPLPVTDVSPEDPVLKNNPPMIGFTVLPEIKSLSKLACFISSQGKIKVNRVAGNRVELRPEQPFTDRRTRINCTLPDDLEIPGEDTHWRWLGLVYVDPEYGDEVQVTDTSGFE